MPRLSGARRALLGAVLLTVASAVAVVEDGQDASAQTGIWTFHYTGAPETFTVPEGVHQLSMVVIGGAGDQPNVNVGAAGASSAVVAQLEVQPGEVFTIWVGGQGDSDGGWGFSCGGARGVAGSFTAYDGGGGGGASAVTVGPYGPPIDCADRPPVSSIVALAGGGGGGGGGALMPDQEPPFSLGGVGGDGGDPPTSGGSGAGDTPGGCGGCRPDILGGHGTDQICCGGGGGGGGGGLRGGEGGTSTIGAGGAGGGGGGSSYASSSATNVVFLPGAASGPGSVTLTTSTTEFFDCIDDRQFVTLPSDIGYLTMIAQGGHGGTRGVNKGGTGGPGGFTQGTAAVDGGEVVTVFVGCQGNGEGGFGLGNGGNGGVAPDQPAYDGGGGGGASAVAIDDVVWVVAGGGGGGGGDGGAPGDPGGGGTGGNGGAGGLPAQPGTGGQGPGGAHGCGGCIAGLDGQKGGDSDRASLGGGGGAGGGGWFGGQGGAGGEYGFNIEGGGGGGAGGGSSFGHPGLTNVEFATSDLAGDGLVQLIFTPRVPASVSAYAGSKQRVIIGNPYSVPLAALVTDTSGQPVSGIAVHFELPGAGASATFAGGGTTHTATTGANGVAVAPAMTANLTAGAWQATATVAGVSEPGRFSLTNRPSPTTTHVTASSDPATPTEDVTFTAMVTADSATAGHPTGTVQFTVDGAAVNGAVPVVNGVATSPLPVTELEPGNHVVVATFEPTDDFLGSEGSLTLPVEKTPTATHVTSSVNPALATEEITFTATVMVPPGNAAYEGQVQFQVDGVDFGAPVAAVNGVATSQSTMRAVSETPYTITATAIGDADYLGSTGSMLQYVDPDGTAMHLSTPTNPIEYGVPVELDATVVPKTPLAVTPSGDATFTVDGGTGCTGSLAADAPNATTACQLPSLLEPGAHDAVGEYPGDDDFKGSSGSLVLQVTKAKTTTAVIGSPAGMAVYGQPVTFRAEVERRFAGSGTPTGTVQFTIDGTELGAPVALVDGAATSPEVTPPMSAGAHVITAVYSGDGHFFASTGVTSYRVEPAQTTVSLTASPEPSQEGEAITFDVDVSALVAVSPPVTPVGSVELRIDGKVFGSPVELTDGRATITGPDDLPVGLHDVSATYLPSTDDFHGSHTSIVHDVREPSVTLVASSENPAPEGTTVTLHAHVGPVARSGTLTFFVDGSPVPGCIDVPVELSGGQCPIAGLAVGDHDVRVSYSGGPTLDPSSGSLVQAITPLLVPRFTG